MSLWYQFCFPHKVPGCLQLVQMGAGNAEHREDVCGGGADSLLFYDSAALSSTCTKEKQYCPVKHFVNCREPEGRYREMFSHEMFLKHLKHAIEAHACRFKCYKSFLSCSHMQSSTAWLHSSYTITLVSFFMTFSVVPTLSGYFCST